MLIGLPVTVVGAGIGGLAAALALARRGAVVTVLEQAPEIAEVGAGIQVSPNGMAVLAALGLRDAVVGAGLVSRAVILRAHDTGAPVLRMDQSRYASGPHPFVLIHRAQLIEALAAAARAAGVELRPGHRVAPSDPRLPGERMRVVADGLKSQARAVLNGPETPFFTGQAAWRAVILGGGAPEAQVFMGPGRHLVTYPLDGGRRNIVAVEERGAWIEEGWSLPDNPVALRAAFAGFAPVVRDWLEQVRTVHVWGLFRHSVARVWHDETTALLGDAAHPTLPFLAQGANLALEDAWVLADCLAQRPVPVALTLYQARRRPRVERAIAAANANARNFHFRNPVARYIGHTTLRLAGRIAPDAALRRFAWLYDYDVTRH